MTFVYTDGRSYGPVPLPQSLFVPRGDWTTGLSYQPRDLVSVTGSLYACRAAHVAGVFNDDLVAGRWQSVALQGRPGITLQGLYSATTAYVEGDGVLYFATGNAVPVLYRLCYVPAAGVPAGTAPGARDPVTGYPYWLPVTTATTRMDVELSWAGPMPANARLVTRYTAVGYTLAANLPNSVLMLLVAPTNALSLPILQLRPNPPVSGQPPTWNSIANGTLNWAAGSITGTANTPAMTFLPGDALVVQGPATQDTRAAYLQSAVLGDFT